MRNENFITIQGWMVNELKLKGNELMLYALIYGFSQDGKSEFHGSIRYIMEFMGISNPTVQKLLKNLLKKKFIQRTRESHYRCIRKLYTKKEGVSESYTLGVQETYTNKDNTNNNIAEASSAEETLPKKDSSTQKENNSLYDKKEKVPQKEKEPFDCDAEIKKMIDDKQKHIEIIGRYFIDKKYSFPDKTAMNTQLKRHLRPAREIARYDDKRFKSAYLLVKKKFEEMWTLETIAKYIPRV